MDAILAILASLTALAAVVLSPIVSIHVAKRQIGAQVVSANRQQWINRLRDELAHFIREVRHAPSAHAANLISEPEAVNRYEDLAFREEVIKLMLNPAEPEHVELLRLLASARDKTLKALNAKKGMASEQDAVANLIVAAAQKILKAEWTRVKRGD